VIEPKGPVYSSSADEDILSTWSTYSTWRPEPKLRVKHITHPDGHDNHAVSVEGLLDDGCSGSQSENGIYLQQPSYDDIEGKPQYIMMRGTERRHIFFKGGKFNCWQICRYCTDAEGAFARSSTAELTGPWLIIPPMQKETRATIKIVRKSNATSQTLDDTPENAQPPAATDAATDAASAARLAAPTAQAVPTGDDDLLKWEER
jgi:hypothetical protein